MDNGKYIGGISPAFDAITTEPELAVKFMNKLFKNQPDVDEKVKKLLFASLLRFYADFENLLEKEPLQRFKNKRKHVVIDQIEQIRIDCGLDKEMFIQWQIEVR